ncbi:MAG TPA: MFS transporter [Chthonomonadaceae bacterium]|nr:MFS transporter [Chthonomonadaceae bacterium]
MATPTPGAGDRFSLRGLTRSQWNCGIAAWLGWLFDGMDGTLYTLAAPVFVGQLLALHREKPELQGAWVQFWFLVGWACGGAVFGRVGDRIGRSRTIMLTILTYALFTGLSSIAHSWQELAVYRFLAALGIGGEWAAGSSLVAETWPKRWRPELSAILQSAYQVGYLIAAASLTIYSAAVKNPDMTRWIFLIGVLPSLVTFWIRRNIPEPEEWETAKSRSTGAEPKTIDLFRGPVLRTTVLTIMMCSVALTAIWGLIFWSVPQLQGLKDISGWRAVDKQAYSSQVTLLATLTAIAGNFLAAFLARRIGYRAAAGIMFAGGAACMSATYGLPHNHFEMIFWLPVAHLFIQGIFGLFPLYVPPLFPTLLRTTGAGFSYNIGRVVAAVGTVGFGVIAAGAAHHGAKPDLRVALFYLGLLPIAGVLVSFVIPEPPAAEPAAAA